MADRCGTCMFLDENNKKSYSTNPMFYCKEIGGYHEQTDRACRYYRRRFGCYIVTEVVNSLDYSEDCILLKTFNDWREDVLENDKRYDNLLEKYDEVGPIISNAISQDPISKLMCISLMNYYLVPISDMIKENDNETAISKYVEMVTFLEQRYDIDITEQKYYDYGQKRELSKAY